MDQKYITNLSKENEYPTNLSKENPTNLSKDKNKYYLYQKYKNKYFNMKNKVNYDKKNRVIQNFNNTKLQNFNNTKLNNISNIKYLKKKTEINQNNSSVNKSYPKSGYIKERFELNKKLSKKSYLSKKKENQIRKILRDQKIVYNRNPIVRKNKINDFFKNMFTFNRKKKYNINNSKNN